MAVAVVMTFDGAEMSQYDEVQESMGFEPWGTGPPGLLFHWITKTDDGMRVTDVWKTQEEFEQFAEEKIGPSTAQAGIPGPPAMEFHEVYNYMTEG